MVWFKNYSQFGQLVLHFDQKNSSAKKAVEIRQIKVKGQLMLEVISRNN